MTDLPNPTPEQVALWFKNGLDRDFLHQVGWQDVNKNFHGIARAARPYIQANYTTPEEQEAAFDGLTLALLALSHFKDIDNLQSLLQPVVQPQVAVKANKSTAA
jgi:hypothetical protein